MLQSICVFFIPLPAAQGELSHINVMYMTRLSLLGGIVNENSVGEGHLFPTVAEQIQPGPPSRLSVFGTPVRESLVPKTSDLSPQA